MFLVACAAVLSQFAVGQDRLPTMPRYDRYQKVRGEAYGSVRLGIVQVDWAADGNSFDFDKDGKLSKFNIETGRISAVTPNDQDDQAALGANPPSLGARAATPRGKNQQEQSARRRPARGRQFDETYSPDGTERGFYRDHNVWISKADGSDPFAVTTLGSVPSRTKFGQASWVYGEELEVHEAMWWSPDGKKLAFYGFDESKVPDYYVAMDQTGIQDKLDSEAYPKAGVSNPIVSLSIYDVAAKTTTEVDTKFGDSELGEYVYNVRWSPDGKELLFNRTNRLQNHMQLAASDSSTGKCRVVVDESWPASWVENHPHIEWLDDRRFLWLSERNGFRNIYLGNLDGRPLKPITQFTTFEVQSIAAVDSKRGIVFFTARDGDNPYRLQLHRVNLDGTNERRLTNPAFSHTVTLAPDDRHFTDIEQTLDIPPTTLLCDDNGKVIDTLAKSDESGFDKLGMRKAERIKFKAADGVTELYGFVMFPSDFDPSKKYPLLVSVYGGPESGSGEERFSIPNPITEMGYIVAWFDGRGTDGRGKAFKDAIYKKLGIVEIDDQAAGVKYLDQRPYIDSSRVGIYGTSYGGYASLMCLLRHPEAFSAAAACSPVTDWRNYDSIYTERYMGLPNADDNLKGYQVSAAAFYAHDLKGRLMLYYGTADNNVHPSNTLQVIEALQRAGKSFDVMVGPDMGHSAMNTERMWEFFEDSLVLHEIADK